MKEITDEKLNKYFEVAEKSLAKIKIAVPKESHNHKIALDFLDMATRYISDAKHYRKKGDYVTAFASLNYAHGWLDAGARLGLFDVGYDSELFTVD
jgi:hypothetical protein